MVGTAVDWELGDCLYMCLREKERGVVLCLEIFDH